MKKIAILIVISILFQNISYAFVPREVEIVKEKIIPFSFTSENNEILESFSLEGLKGALIKETYVDNGQINAKIVDNYIDVNLKNGVWNDSYKNVNKIKSIELKDIQLEDEINRKTCFTPKEDVISILETTGDFSKAKVLPNGEIEINIAKNIKGNIKYDENQLEKSTFEVKVNDKNRMRNVESDEVILPYNVVGSIRPQSGDTSYVEDIIANGNRVKVLFNNGVPRVNESVINSGYSYYWIDRNTEGFFNDHNPNSVYSTDKNKITGKGDYVKGEEFKNLYKIYDSNWTDYIGIEKNGVRYVYLINKNKGIPKEFSGDLINGSKIEFNNQEFNSEKNIVEFSNTGVTYIPEGKLYSMGELVPNTRGWGEVAPNRSWESKKTFFNEITGKYETYVKHFKFFYGPKQKKTFGGYYTYPYSCYFTYNHYKPVECFSGNIIYEYLSKEKVKGYSYNGWIKVAYKEKTNVNDYPPKPPFNVKYNDNTGDISWEKATDDYTIPENLKYEIQVFDGTWKTIANSVFERLIINKKINYSEAKVRIRAIDEVGQVSEWAYSSESEIELEGELKPYIIKSGENINITATTKSLNKIKNVVAKCDEIQMYSELHKTKEKSSAFTEVGYDIVADFPDYSYNYLAIANSRVATGNKNYIITGAKRERSKFKYGNPEYYFDRDIKFNKEGTIIYSNINYDDIPREFFRYDESGWYLFFDNNIYIKNKKTKRKEAFIKISSDIGSRDRILYPYHTIGINMMDYDSNGTTKYKYISVDKNLLNKPLTVTWDTDVNSITTFNIYLGNEIVYKYSTKWSNIEQNVDKLYSVYMYKYMARFTKTYEGYIYSHNRKSANWSNIVMDLMPGRDIRQFQWLGYRVRNNEYVRQNYVSEYNSSPNVRNNYRVLVSDTCLAERAINNYLDILKSTNMTMSIDRKTVFGDDAMQYTSNFEANNIKIANTVKPGEYIVNLIATDEMGQTAEIKLKLIVKANEEDPKEEIPKEDIEIEDVPITKGNYFGRYFYKDGKGYLEELKKTDTSNFGFICAGETLGSTILAKNTQYIEVDFKGDSSVKTFDKLTKKFLVEDPLKNGKEIFNVESQYKFPHKIYPQYVDKNGLQIYKFFYTIPYKTKQNLESWSTLKNDSLENIDNSKVFNRITSPYELVFYLNGDREKEISLPFDVFERWDTVLNRDVSKYITNKETKWEMRIDK